MPGNREIFDNAMAQGDDAAWNQNWNKAIEFYGRAVAEFPSDPVALNSLGMTLIEVERIEDALKVYIRAGQVSPDDPIPQEKLADVYERLGRLSEASERYVNVAEIYIGQRDIDKAIGNWERAARLTPTLVEIRQRLAMAYERTGKTNAAVREYLAMAGIFQSQGNGERAIQIAQRALRLDSGPQVLNTLQALKAGLAIAVPTPPGDEEDGEESKVERVSVDAWDDWQPDESIADDDPRGPVGEAVEAAIGDLASYLFESGLAIEESGQQASHAIELQRQEDFDAAIGAYMRAMGAGMEHPSLYVNLGVMMVEQEQYEEALPHLKNAVIQPNYAAGALFALGKAQHALGSTVDAGKSLLRCLKMVDMNLAVSAERDELNMIYDGMVRSLDARGEEQIAAMNQTLLTRLVGTEWKRNVANTRRQLQEAARLEEDSAGLLDILAAGSGDKLTAVLSGIERYMRRGMYRLAMDEAHYAVEISPFYLPVHIRIAELLIAMGEVPQAIAKYNTIVETYLSRNDRQKALQMLDDALKVAPMDITMRVRLLQMLQEDERWEDVLDQRLDLGDTYYQLADLEAARQNYVQAQQLARRINIDNGQLLQIMRRIGDIDVARLNLRQALRTYQQIRDLDPEDENARLTLMDLNYRLNNPIGAIRELDSLLRIYAKEKRIQDIVKVLEEQVTMRSDDIALRRRLASVYRQVGNKPKAIEQLDTLGNLQLDAGLTDDAIETIRQIVQLNPPNVQEYKNLLNNLSSGSTA